MIALHFQLSAKCISVFVVAVYDAIIDDFKVGKPVIYAGELNWQDGFISIESSAIQEGISVGTIFEDQPQPFAEILKVAAEELYLDVLALVSHCFLFNN